LGVFTFFFRDAAYACVVELGKYSLVQFKDVNL